VLRLCGIISGCFVAPNQMPISHNIIDFERVVYVGISFNFSQLTFSHLSMSFASNEQAKSPSPAKGRVSQTNSGKHQVGLKEQIWTM